MNTIQNITHDNLNKKSKSSKKTINIQSIKGTSAEKLLIAKKIMQCILKDIESMGNFNICFKKNDRLPAYKAQSVLNGLVRSLCDSLFASIYAKEELNGAYNELNTKQIKNPSSKNTELESNISDLNHWDNVGKYKYYEQKYGE